MTKSTSFIVLSLTVALLLACVAWLSSLTPQGGPRVAIVSPPLEFWMELGKTEYAYEENMTITFCLENIGNETVTVGKSSMDGIEGFTSTEASGVNDPRPSAFHFGFSIADDNGTVIYERFRGWAQEAYSFTVEPNGYLRQIFFWSQYGFLASPLPRGAYQIRGIFRGHCTPGFDTSILETPSITFMIG